MRQYTRLDRDLGRDKITGFMFFDKHQHKTHLDQQKNGDVVIRNESGGVRIDEQNIDMLINSLQAFKKRFV